VRQYFYTLLARYLALFVRPDDTLLEIDPASDLVLRSFANGRAATMEELRHSEVTLDEDYVLLNGVLHYVRDIQGYLDALHGRLRPETRVILTYYSSAWKPLFDLATTLGIRRKSLEPNWLAPEDVENLLTVSDYEVIRADSKVLLPVYVPVISELVNRFLAPLPIIRWFTMVNILVARPLFATDSAATPSVSVVVPARNEAGNIPEIVRRLPAMGPDDELIFIEGGSSDDTWQRIQDIQRELGGERNIVIGQQEGRGKGDAVRKGFGLASKDILMILDADMTVPPEDLPKFYRALVSGKGEFINGSRLVYPMEKEAMRFLNLLGNKFFALAFSFVLGQRFKDTLCGTKVLSRRHYEKVAARRSFFGDFDPFGDFDLIFGAARLGLRIVEIPILYRERTYGTTNISRWRHGALLLRMLVFASLRLKLI